MRNSKKAVSLFLVVIMIIGIFTVVPTGVFAAEADETAAVETETFVTDIAAPREQIEKAEPAATGADDYTIIKIGETKKISSYHSYSSGNVYGKVKCIAETDMVVRCTIYQTGRYQGSIYYDVNPPQLYSVYTELLAAGQEYKETIYTLGTYTVTMSEVLPDEIKPGQTAAVEIKDDHQPVYMKFVPERDMNICYAAQSDFYTSGTIQTIEEDEGRAYASHLVIASVYEENFKITTRVQRGKTYYLSANYKNSQSGTFTVSLEENETPEIKFGDCVTVNISKSGETAYLKFVPYTEMRIRFDPGAFYGCMYNAEMDELYSYSSGNTLTCYVEAGETYYFGLNLNDGRTGYNDVLLQGIITPRIRLGETVNAVIEKGGDSAYYSFVPETDMTVIFSAESDKSLTGELFDENMQQLYGGFSWNATYTGFSITYDVKAGQIYYLKQKFSSDSAVGTITASVNSKREWGDWAYYACYDGSAKIIGYTGTTAAELMIPKTIKGYTVTEIGKKAFYEHTELTGVTVPDTVKAIGSYAFWGCENLRSITFTGSVKSIGVYAFGYCKQLEKVDIHDLAAWCQVDFGIDANNMTHYESGDYIVVFGHCSNPLELAHNLYIDGKPAEELIIPDSVSHINPYAFLRGSNIKSVTFPSSVTFIGRGAFAGTGLTSVQIPDSVRSLGDSAFFGCSKMNALIIGNGITELEPFVFSGCSSLTAISIPDSVTRIGHHAFSNCLKLAEVDFGSWITEIGESAFYNCEGLTGITFPASVKQIGSEAFYDCINLKSITIPCLDLTIDSMALGWYLRFYTVGGGSGDEEEHEDAKVAGVTLYGFEGTSAETYAKGEGFAFVPLGDKPKIGDADGDGKLTIMDVTEVQCFLAKTHTETSGERLPYADVDGNGVLEIIDATFIQRRVANMEIPYAIG